MPFSTTHPTISTGGINSILNAIQQMGIDLVVLKKEVGLDKYNLEDSELRLSCQYAAECYQFARHNWEGSNFGLIHGLKYQPFTLGIVGHLLTTASTGLEALQSYERYQQAFGEGLIISLKDKTDSSSQLRLLSARLWVHAEMQGKVDSTLIDSFFVALVNCVRLLTGEHKPFLRVELQRPAPENNKKYLEAFACPVIFSQTNNQVILSSEWLETPLLTANPALYQMLEQQSNAMIKRIGDINQFSNQVRQEILKCIDGNKIDVKRVAQRLSMSARTLQRRLNETGDTFQRILDEVRTEFSVQHIKLNRTSIDELAYLLGFSEPSIYRKTFKRWTGQTPTEYRLSLSA